METAVTPRQKIITLSLIHISLPFTITFITASIIPYLRKKAQLLLDFFDRLRWRHSLSPSFI